MYNKRGVTLIELVVFIIIVSLIMIPLSVIIREVLARTVLPEHYSIAGELAKKEMERFIKGRMFSDISISTTGPNSYTGNFSQYSYTVTVGYVNSGDLNTIVAGPTSYKMATITIARTGFPSVSLVTLATDNGDSL